MEADIFTLTDFKSPRKAEGNYTYQIRCYDSKGCERTIWDREPIKTFRTINTKNGAELVALRDALKRMKKPCDIQIYTDSDYIKNGIENWSAGWIEADWITTKGETVANADIWKEVLELISIHTAVFHIREHHEYYQIMKSVLEKAEKPINSK